MTIKTKDLKSCREYFGRTGPSLIVGVLFIAALGLILRFVLGYFF